MDLVQEVEVAETESPKKKHKKQASKTEIAVAIPDKKGKGKGKEKESAVHDEATEQAMEVDNIVEVESTKKPRKKAANVVEPEPQGEEATAKKGKKKRKAAGSD